MAAQEDPANSQRLMPLNVNSWLAREAVVKCCGSFSKSMMSRCLRNRQDDGTAPLGGVCNLN